MSYIFEQLPRRMACFSRRLWPDSKWACTRNLKQRACEESRRSAHKPFGATLCLGAGGGHREILGGKVKRSESKAVLTPRGMAGLLRSRHPPADPAAPPPAIQGGNLHSHRRPRVVEGLSRCRSEVEKEMKEWRLM